MAVYHLGKFTHQVASNSLAKFSDVQLDTLWYLMDLAKIHRFDTLLSFKEFLMRYFLITDRPLEEIALDYIDEHQLIAGIYNHQPFQLSIGDLYELIGFSASDYVYNITGTMEHFMQSYSFVPPNPTCKIKSEVRGEEKVIQINQTMLAYALMGLGTLCNIESLTLPIRQDNSRFSKESLLEAEKLADFIIAQMPEEVRKKLAQKHSDQRERWTPSLTVKFDPLTLDPKVLKNLFNYVMEERWYEAIADEPIITPFLVEEHGLNWYLSHIQFAVGVKWGYITLNDNPLAFHACIDPVFEIEFEDLLGGDNELFSTAEIYQLWDMEAWVDWLPEKP